MATANGSFTDPYANITCIVCNLHCHEDLLMLCDKCDSAAHTYCVGLRGVVPAGNWFCRSCRSQLVVAFAAGRSFGASAYLSWELLEDITDGFSKERIIGRGGFGVVYKGVYQNGQVIAVKKLYHMPGLDEKQFENELKILNGLRHQNIVPLVGYGYEEQDRCVEYNGKLVFAKMVDRVICLEYLHNGSLEKHISDESSLLPWNKSYKIIKGICHGLKYLHDNKVYHLDLKPANILLNNDMEPKITDFGFSRLFSGTRESHTTIHFSGTLGYMPPEYIEKGKISDKFDVFSLGVIIIKILTGSNGYSRLCDMPRLDFVELVHGNWRKMLVNDADLEDASYLDACCDQVKSCIGVALNCLEVDRHKRPSIGDIICTLNGTLK